VDYTHVFVSVHWNRLRECLKKFDVPDKLTLIHTKARVKVDRDFIEKFIVKCGVKQGDPHHMTTTD